VIETKKLTSPKRPDNNNGWRCANFHCSVPGVLSPLGAHCFSIRVSGVHSANCFCLLAPRHLASVYYKPKLCVGTKTQLCMQQLKSGLHCTVNILCKLIRGGATCRVWGGLISMVGGPGPSSLPCPRPWPEVEHFPSILYFQI